MAEEEIPDNFTEAPIFEHLMELKRRLIYVIVSFIIAVGVSYLFAKDIYDFLIDPLYKAGYDRNMQGTGLTEPFFTDLKLAMFAAFFVTMPVVLVQLYLFLAPGLYKHEKSFLLPLLAAAPVLFVMGAVFVYYFIMPLAWEFFLSFQTEKVEIHAKVSEYLELVMHLIIGFGLSFQLPVLLILLAKIGLVTPEGLKRNRRYAVVVIVIVAAILTPPDVISQLGLASVLYALYEISIIAAKTVSKKIVSEQNARPETD